MSRPPRLNEWKYENLHPHPLNAEVFGPLEPGIDALVERIREHGQQRRTEILPQKTIASDGTELPAGTIIKGHRGSLATHLAGFADVKVIERWDLIDSPMEAEFELLSDNDVELYRKITDKIKVRMIAEMRKRTGKSMSDVAEAMGTSKSTVHRAEKIAEAQEVAHPEDKAAIDAVLEEEGIRPAMDLAETVLKERDRIEAAEPKKRRTTTSKPAEEKPRKNPAPVVAPRETPADLPVSQAFGIATDMKRIIRDTLGSKIKKIEELIGAPGGTPNTLAVQTSLERAAELVQDLIDAHLTDFQG
jgi:transcriptional regulator with XRE-family HTH domain